MPVYEALANFTGWWDWDALAAIGTVGALWFAVVQSSQAARVERARKIGTLTTLIGVVEPLTETLPHFDGDTEHLTPTEFATFARAKEDIIRTLRVLENLDPKDVADVGATSWVNALPLILESILSLYPRTLSARVKRSELNAHMSQVAFANDDFRAQRDYLRYGLRPLRRGHVPRTTEASHR